MPTHRGVDVGGGEGRKPNIGGEWSSFDPPHWIALRVTREGPLRRCSPGYLWKALNAEAPPGGPPMEGPPNIFGNRPRSRPGGANVLGKEPKSYIRSEQGQIDFPAAFCYIV